MTAKTVILTLTLALALAAWTPFHLAAAPASKSSRSTALPAAPAGSSKQPARDTSPANPYTIALPVTPETPLDRLISEKLRKAGIKPAAPCSDAVFLRRVYLDVIGTLPTPDETRAFLADANRQKRRLLIDQLLEREEFADYWAMKWCDLLRVKAEFPANLWPNAVQAYHRWIRDSLRENKPYDQIARELLTSSGSNFRVAPVNFYRAVQSKNPEAIAQAVALTLMGSRLEKWPASQQAGLAAFFAKVGYKSTVEWKEEIVFFDSGKEIPAGAAPPVFPDGVPASFTPDQDPRVVFADWLITAQNPWFARNIVNRQWSWLMGRGIIHEPDDIRPDNLPSNPALLSYLERELVSSKYDLKHIFRLILNSQTYQLSSVSRVPNDDVDPAAHFAAYPLRRLEAEVLIDAINRITGSTEHYSSAIPEPFTFIPDTNRTITLADGSITSSFLELFGRASRDTGLEGERSNRPSSAQRLHLLNSTHIQRKLEQNKNMQALFKASADPRVIATEIYYIVLCRPPTEKEINTVLAYAKSPGIRGRDAAIDLYWALLNSDEFLYRH